MTDINDLLNKGFELSNKKIHVLLLHLDDFNENELYDILSKEEKERADKLKVALKKKQFIVSRGMLRKLISNSIDIKHEELIIHYGDHNKPYLGNVYNKNTIEFNVSHSEKCILIAITLENKVGVDIEKINAVIDYDSLAKRFFSNEEYAYLKSLNKDNKLFAFYRIWTRKEAFIKATGKGIAFGLGKFTVLDNSTNKVIINNQETHIEDWYCFDLMCVDHYETALSTNNKGIELIFYQ